MEISGVSFWGGRDSAFLFAASVQWHPEGGLNTRVFEMKVRVLSLQLSFFLPGFDCFSKHYKFSFSS